VTIDEPPEKEDLMPVWGIGNAGHVPNRLVSASIIAASIVALSPGVGAAEAAFCQLGQMPSFDAGFAALKAQLGDTMGEPTECAHTDAATGDSLQQTSTGLSFYRKSTNTPTFTDGTTHWAITPEGVVSWIGNSVDPPDTELPAAATGASPAAAPVSEPTPSATGTPAPTAVAILPPVASTSRNWSGYTATDGAFSATTATWTIPRIVPNNVASTTAIAVGIGGVATADMIEAGTESSTTQSGHTTYGAWTELLPSASKAVPLALQAGDSVTVSIDRQNTDHWLIVFSNNTTGNKFQETLQYSSSLSSADWVVETPGSGKADRYLPLEGFGSVSFSASSTVMNGNRVGLSAAGATPITLTDGARQAIAVASAISDDGTGFTVTRVQPSNVNSTLDP
jgi:hypothetical protein